MSGLATCLVLFGMENTTMGSLISSVEDSKSTQICLNSERWSQGGSPLPPVLVQKPKSLYESLKIGPDASPRVKQEVALRKRVGFYKLRGQLGAGSFSKVKLGVHLLTNEHVAVKVISKPCMDEVARKMLSQEISCLGRMNHPNIIKLFEIIESYESLHLVMECADQGNLLSKITTEGPFAEDQSKRSFAQLASALHYMHQKNIIHRDIKAENILLTSSTVVKLADFGFSVESQDDNFLKTFCGSPPYAAPELFTADCYLGKPVDIWALGVTLFFMLSGKMLFEGSELESVRENVIKGAFSLPEMLTPSCRELFHGVLNKDIAQRYTVGDILKCKWLQNDVELSRILGLTSAATFPFSYPSVEHFPHKIEPHMIFSPVSATSSLNHEILEELRSIGLPVDGVNFIGEPRNPTVGAYRILEHRMHSELLQMLQARRERSVSLGTNLDSRKKGEGVSSRSGRTEFKRSRTTSGLPKRNKRESQLSSKSRVCIIL